MSGRNFLLVDDALVCEMFDTDPSDGGYVGFSAYSTILKIKDIDIYEPCFERISQSYEPEFVPIQSQGNS